MGLAAKLTQLPHPPLASLLLPVRTLPWMARNKPMAAAVNRAFAEPLKEGDFEAMEGQWLHLHIKDMKLDFYLTVENESFRFERPRPCGVTIGGNAADFLSMAARREDPDTLFFNRRITIEGDTELGLTVKNMLDGLDFEQLPGVVQWAIQKLDQASQKLNQQ
ncbi:ubiquinone anaerobic biosynthesis accessory factor UbiT [Parendozoicomonas haliclonae]|uniref:Ubiquinone biosynthesis accessory factor UbiT n=1 Tax=Parendozoicomonas haliclonae TaxID=1960125 RepID=A0A1X7AMZ7_9GAMM|nr:SCP2 sterol-binding domain-containing protein [Parendozoicomonas haliclonae]SMA49435.1 SCP-2 sterol transfer family protein [Parendozoicomonas haliclonae]